MVISTYLNLVISTNRRRCACECALLPQVASLIVDDHEDVRKEAEKTLISISKLLSVTDVTQHALLYFASKRTLTSRLWLTVVHSSGLMCWL